MNYEDVCRTATPGLLNMRGILTENEGYLEEGREGEAVHCSGGIGSISLGTYVFSSSPITQTF